MAKSSSSSNSTSRDSVAQKEAGKAASTKLNSNSTSSSAPKTSTTTTKVSKAAAASPTYMSLTSSSGSGSGAFKTPISTPTKKAAVATGSLTSSGSSSSGGGSTKSSVTAKPSAGAKVEKSGSVSLAQREAISLLDKLNAPYERRVERVGGAPFEGPVDWGGIGAALFGGQSAEERDAALRNERRPPAPADSSTFDPINPGFGPSWEQFSDYTSDSEAWGHPKIDLESGFVFDEATGAYYPPNRLPPSSDRVDIAENRNPIEGLRLGIEAERRRQLGMDPIEWGKPAFGAPRGIDAMAPLPGQTEAPVQLMPDEDPVLDVTVPYGQSDEARYAENNPVAAPKEKTIFDSVVEGAGGLLEHTGLGGAVKALFPDLWFGAGETIKGLDNGINGGSGGGTHFEDTANGGSLIEQPAYTGEPNYGPPPAPFPDVNHNGIDDRLEGLGGTGTPSNQYGRPGSVVFPDMPPYNPGRDDEWLYFRKNMADGGLVQGYAEGGEVAPMPRRDPRVRPGNIDLTTRKVHRGEGGDYRTENSISIGTDEGEVLIPTVIDGVQVTEDEAIQHYYQTGENLGVFRTPESANGFAEQLHQIQADRYAPGYAEGGEVSPLAGQDPRIELIADTEDVLEEIAAGKKPDKQDEKVLRAFVEKFGDGALKQLHDNVKGGMKMRPGKGRMVEGPGGPTDDAIPAMIDGNQPAALSDGEFVIPAAAVVAAGKGDREKGAAQLQALSDMLAGET